MSCRRLCRFMRSRQNPCRLPRNYYLTWSREAKRTLCLDSWGLPLWGLQVAPTIRHLQDGLSIARGAISNRYVSVGIAGAVAEIREGTTLAAALDRPKVFPKLAVEMLSVGEETGS